MQHHNQHSPQNVHPFYICGVSAVISSGLTKTHVVPSKLTTSVVTCRRDGKAITLSHDALLVALVSTAEAVRQATGAKQKAVDMDISVTDADTVSLSLSPSKPASTEAVAERILSGNAASSSQPPAAAKGKGKGGATYAPGTGKRCDLTFLDPMNKADCPPKAIALAAGELVLRMREERRRRKAGGIAADPPLPSRRMSGGKPGRHAWFPFPMCSLAGNSKWTWTCVPAGSLHTWAC